uniref:G_PROTEIN_RECEP_F1_2 domain-containing protein n=1 Tax=Caenorhabditis japonica TaxID=281687 RepID=A0A8R1DLX9_CAEJA
METEYEGGLLNCTYRYPLIEEDTISAYALWIDGPCTCLAALLSLVGARYAIKFLCRAGLNKELTAALFALCAIDSLLLVTVFFFYGIEAMSVLFFRTNVMYDKQAFTYNLHGIASSLTTSSTMLVIYITFLRFMVVVRPLRFATSVSANHRRTGSKFVRKGSANLEDSMTNATIFSRSTYNSSSMKRRYNLREIVRPFYTPFLFILFSFSVNIPIFFEFTTTKCFDVEHQVEAANPEPTMFRETFSKYKAVLMTLTQTIGPVSVILVLSILTEYKVHMSLKARRKLFESQQRSRSVVLSEELKERVSRTVAVFIAVKFLIFRTMPIFFDVYENLYGIDNWGTAMSIMVRVSDYLIVLNTATNSLAYFGKKRWIEKRLHLRLLKKEEKRNAKASLSANGSLNKKPTKIGLSHPLCAEKTPLTSKNIYPEMV